MSWTRDMTILRAVLILIRTMIPDNDGSDADEEMDEEFSTPEMSSQCETQFGASKENVI